MSNGFIAWLAACLRRVKTWLAPVPAARPVAPLEAAAPAAKVRRAGPPPRPSRQQFEMARDVKVESHNRSIESSSAQATHLVPPKIFILYGEHPVEVVERRRRDGAPTRTRFFLTVGVDEPRAISFDQGVFVAIGGEERRAYLFVPATDLNDPVRFRRAYRMLDELCARLHRPKG